MADRTRKKGGVRLDHYDREIIRFLGKRGKSNTNEVSTNLKISWITTNVHLKKLKIMGYVLSEKEGELVNWELNY